MRVFDHKLDLKILFILICKNHLFEIESIFRNQQYTLHQFQFVYINHSIETENS